MAPTNTNVVVIIGVGDIGLAIARRIAQGRQLLIATRQTATLTSAAETLRNAGHSVATHQVDITDYKSVEDLVVAAQALGRIETVVLTSGVSPKTFSTQDLYAVDVLGTVNVIDAFLPVVGPGSSMVCLSSAAAHLFPLSPSLTKHLATAPRDRILDHAELQGFDGTEYAYPVAKKGNLLRIQASSKAYGLKGARINSVSPGLITSKMGKTEMEGLDDVKKMHENCAIGRLGTVDEVANVVEFLAGPGSSYVTGSDILVDGGVTPIVLFPPDGQKSAIDDSISNVSAA